MKQAVTTAAARPPHIPHINGVIPTPKAKMLKAQARTLRIHPRAQRGLIPSHLKRIMAELDLDAIGVLHCVEYEIGGVVALWIIDGQHRWRALMDHGFGEWEVEVKVHLEAKTDARAAALFLKLNARKGVNPIDRFKAACQAGDRVEVGVLTITSERNLRVWAGDGNPGDGVVRCVNALCAAYRIDSGKTLTATMDTIIAAWGRTAAALEGKVIEGIALVYKTYPSQIDQAVLTKKLAKYPGGASGLLGDARGIRERRAASVPRCLAERVVEEYNHGRRTGRLDPL